MCSIPDWADDEQLQRATAHYTLPHVKKNTDGKVVSKKQFKQASKLLFTYLKVNIPSADIKKIGVPTIEQWGMKNKVTPFDMPACRDHLIKKYPFFSAEEKWTGAGSGDDSDGSTNSSTASKDHNRTWTPTPKPWPSTGLTPDLVWGPPTLKKKKNNSKSVSSSLSVSPTNPDLPVAIRVVIERRRRNSVQAIAKSLTTIATVLARPLPKLLLPTRWRDSKPIGRRNCLGTTRRRRKNRNLPTMMRKNPRKRNKRKVLHPVV